MNNTEKHSSELKTVKAIEGKKTQLEIDETRTRIKKIRVQRGYSVKQISEMLGIRETLYKQYEDDPMNMPSKYMVNLSRFYQASSDYLLGLSDSPEIDFSEPCDAQVTENSDQK